MLGFIRREQYVFWLKTRELHCCTTGNHSDVFTMKLCFDSVHLDSLLYVFMDVCLYICVSVGML